MDESVIEEARRIMAELLVKIESGDISGAAAALGDLVDRPGDDALSGEDRRAVRLRRLAEAVGRVIPG